MIMMKKLYNRLADHIHNSFLPSIENADFDSQIDLENYPHD